MDTIRRLAERRDRYFADPPQEPAPPPPPIPGSAADAAEEAALAAAARMLHPRDAGVEPLATDGSLMGHFEIAVHELGLKDQALEEAAGLEAASEHLATVAALGPAADQARANLETAMLEHEEIGRTLLRFRRSAGVRDQRDLGTRTAWTLKLLLGIAEVVAITIVLSDVFDLPLLFSLLWSGATSLGSVLGPSLLAGGFRLTLQQRGIDDAARRGQLPEGLWDLVSLQAPSGAVRSLAAAAALLFGLTSLVVAWLRATEVGGGPGVVLGLAVLTALPMTVAALVGWLQANRVADVAEYWDRLEDRAAKREVARRDILERHLRAIDEAARAAEVARLRGLARLHASAAEAAVYRSVNPHVYGYGIGPSADKTAWHRVAVPMAEPVGTSASGMAADRPPTDADWAGHTGSAVGNGRPPA